MTQVCHRVVFRSDADVISRATTSWCPDSKNPRRTQTTGVLRVTYTLHRERNTSGTPHGTPARGIVGRMPGATEPRRDVRRRQHHIPEEKTRRWRSRDTSSFDRTVAGATPRRRRAAAPRTSPHEAGPPRNAAVATRAHQPRPRGARRPRPRPNRTATAKPSRGFARELRRARPPPNQARAPTTLRANLRLTSHSHYISDVPPPPKPLASAAPHENVERNP